MVGCSGRLRLRASGPNPSGTGVSPVPDSRDGCPTRFCPLALSRGGQEWAGRSPSLPQGRDGNKGGSRKLSGPMRSIREGDVPAAPALPPPRAADVGKDNPPGEFLLVFDLRHPL